MAMAASTFAFKKAKQTAEAKANTNSLEIWYKPNIPLGIGRGIFPGRVAWGHNPEIASWDGKTGFWWEDQFNNQGETDKLLSQTLLSLTNIKNEKNHGMPYFIPSIKLNGMLIQDINPVRR